MPLSFMTSMGLSLELLPVELIADILNELDLASLITMSSLSKRLRAVASDVSEPEDSIRFLIKSSPRTSHLSTRGVVPC